MEMFSEFMILYEKNPLGIRASWSTIYHWRLTPEQPWSIPMMIWLTSFVSNVFMTKHIRSLYTNTPTCLHIDVTHLSLTTAVGALQIYRSVDVGREICRYHNNLHGDANHKKTYMILIFGNISIRCKHNHNKPYQYRRQDVGWHALSIVTHATVWRRKFYLYTTGLTKQYQTNTRMFEDDCRTIYQDKRDFTISLSIGKIYISIRMMTRTCFCYYHVQTYYIIIWCAD